LAAQGLHGLQAGFRTTAQGLQGLHGLQALAAAQGLHGLAAAQGLQGLHAAAQGLHAAHGLHAAAAHGLHGLHAPQTDAAGAHVACAGTATTLAAVTAKPAMPAAASSFLNNDIGIRNVSLSQYEMAPSHTGTQRHGVLKSCVFARPRLSPIHTGKYDRRKVPRNPPLGIVNRREPGRAVAPGRRSCKIPAGQPIACGGCVVTRKAA